MQCFGLVLKKYHCLVSWAANFLIFVAILSKHISCGGHMHLFLSVRAYYFPFSILMTYAFKCEEYCLITNDKMEVLVVSLLVQ